MNRFPRHTLETAPAASRTTLSTVQQKMGFIPNLLAGMAEAPALLQGYLTLAGLFDQSSFSESERQIVLMTINRLHGCHYCMAAHTVIARGAGVPEEIIQALRDAQPLADAKHEALRQLTISLNEGRGQAAPDVVANFYAAGYQAQQLLEVIVGISLKVMSNYTNRVSSTPLDAAFQPAQWSAPSCSTACHHA